MGLKNDSGHPGGAPPAVSRPCGLPVRRQKSKARSRCAHPHQLYRSTSSSSSSRRTIITIMHTMPATSPYYVLQLLPLLCTRIASTRPLATRIRGGGGGHHSAAQQHSTLLYWHPTNHATSRHPHTQRTHSTNCQLTPSLQAESPHPRLAAIGNEPIRSQSIPSIAFFHTSHRSTGRRPT
jgi:hypothetical protein